MIKRKQNNQQTPRTTNPLIWNYKMMKMKMDETEHENHQKMS